MKKILVAATAGLFLLASAPAIACDGHAADKPKDEKIMTSVDDGAKPDATTSKKKKKKAEAKKEESEEKAEAAEGEV